jgi:hypothetical protein
MLGFMIPSHFSFAKRKSRFVILPATPFLRVNGNAVSVVKQVNVVCNNLRGRSACHRIRSGDLYLVLA